MSEAWLTNLAMLFFETETGGTINFDDVIREFEAIKVHSNILTL